MKSLMVLSIFRFATYADCSAAMRSSFFKYRIGRYAISYFKCSGYDEWETHVAMLRRVFAEANLVLPEPEMMDILTDAEYIHK